MKKTILSATIILASIGVTQAAGHHPRRAEVNTRLAHQNYRIDKKEEEGKMSAAEASKLHKQDHQIRQEEKDMASQDGCHITKQEKKTLNQQEDHVSKEIKDH
jgi:hypothetical protein